MVLLCGRGNLSQRLGFAVGWSASGGTSDNSHCSLLNDLATRIVIPLVKRSAFGGEAMQGLIPEISFADQELLLLTPQISSVPERHLKNPVGSLSHFSDQIVGALDLAITGI